MSKIVVGMSGGVDSSVAAFLLKEQGHEVIGVTSVMNMQGDNLSAHPDVSDAISVCNLLGIEHKIVDMRKEFEHSVIAPFVCAYSLGQTPNPCNLCNRYIKWEALIQIADSLGADYIATGHYARIERYSNGRFSVRNSKTAAKDQTYALCMLTQSELSRTLMPLGDYTKEEIRAIAASNNLPVAHKHDSQDICFIPDGDYASYIDSYAKARATDDSFTFNAPHPGHFIDVNGSLLGTHKGITHYTIGQRRGLTIAAGTRIFVKSINPDTNEIILSDNDSLFSTELIADNVNMMSMEKLTAPVKALTKIRYAHKGTMSTIFPINDTSVRIIFDEPVRAITPGQNAVFYEDDHILGSGIIRQ